MKGETSSGGDEAGNWQGVEERTGLTEGAKVTVYLFPDSKKERKCVNRHRDGLIILGFLSFLSSYDTDLIPI